MCCVKGCDSPGIVSKGDGQLFCGACYEAAILDNSWWPPEGEGKIIDARPLGLWSNGSYTIDWVNQDEVKITNPLGASRVIAGGDLETVLSVLFI